MRILTIITLLILAVGSLSFAAEPLKIVASTTDLAAVAREVGGARVTVEALCRGDQDPHDFEILPSQVMQVQQADIYLKVGLALDPWADKLIQSAGNTRLRVVDCSHGIDVIGKAEHHSENSPHPLGNPHYWLGPSNLITVAETIRDAFKDADSSYQDVYGQRGYTFRNKMESAISRWKTTLAPCSGMGLVSSHPSWDYFARDFGLEIVGTVSRVPDAEPSPVELATLEQTIRTRSRVVFLREPFTSDRFPNVLARDTGISVLTVPSSVGALPQVTDLWSQFDYLTTQLALHCQKP
ncbi:MAG TPA: metal ABC transporter substrate-binding protein [bacterium]